MTNLKPITPQPLFLLVFNPIGYIAGFIGKHNIILLTTNKDIVVKKIFGRVTYLRNHVLKTKFLVIKLCFQNKILQKKNILICQKLTGHNVKLKISFKFITSCTKIVF